MVVMDEPTANLDFGNQLRVLERPREPRSNDLPRSPAHRLDTVELHRARIGSVEAGERVEQRGLSGSVGADERLDGARVNVE